MNKIVFDVGANNGDTCFHFALEDSSNQVWAFEPTKELIEQFLAKKIRPNYHVVEAAVSNYEGESIFHIAGQADWGCSSLKEFHPNIGATWPGRTDLKVTHSYPVKVIRLDLFMERNNIPRIDFLHIDAQGSDMEVLMGLGDKINYVKAGQIEVAHSHEVALYKEMGTLAESLEFLKKNNFIISSIEPNDGFNFGRGNDVNVYFQRP